jgi:hypothetical protein
MLAWPLRFQTFPLRFILLLFKYRGPGHNGPSCLVRQGICGWLMRSAACPATRHAMEGPAHDAAIPIRGLDDG